MRQTTKQKRELLQKCGYPAKLLESHLRHVARIVEDDEGRYFAIWKHPIDTPLKGDDLYIFLERNTASFAFIIQKLQTEDIRKLCIWQCKNGLHRLMTMQGCILGLEQVQPITEATKNALIAGYKEVLLEHEKKARATWEKRTK